MKARHGLFLLAMGFILTFVGALFKLESWPGSSEMLLAGMVFQVAGGVFGRTQ